MGANLRWRHLQREPTQMTIILDNEIANLIQAERQMQAARERMAGDLLASTQASDASRSDRLRAA